MSQRFRRNIAPVLGALLLIVAGIAVWAGFGVVRTQEATEALHARFVAGATPWSVPAPEDGYVVFDYLREGGRCVTLSLLPEAATLLPAGGEARTVGRDEAALLAEPVARLAAACDRLRVRVFAVRLPYHGRFTVHYAGGAVTRVEDADFGG